MTDFPKINIGIVGAAGYTGGELIRILLNHPFVNIQFAQSKSNAGNEVHIVHQDLIGETELMFSEMHSTEGIDLLFLCAGHGEAKKFLENNVIAPSIKIIDIGNDFRLNADANFQTREFVYGLPEINRSSIISAKNIANPGCFATAIQLALLPLAVKQELGKVYVTGITGSTGAGQSLSATSHFSWRANNIQAYKTLAHQHLGEIHETLFNLQPNNEKKSSVNFIPWRGDFARGIFISAQMENSNSLDELNKMYQQFYSEHPFVTISKEPISLKQVVNTNKAVIQLEKVADQLVVHAAIDNLIKGASGQAVQNMNLMFGFPENTGLQLKATSF